MTLYSASCCTSHSTCLGGPDASCCELSITICTSFLLHATLCIQAGPGSDAMPYHGFCGCLGGPDAGYLVHPIYRSQSVCVTHLATGGSFHLHGDPPEVNVVVANERSVLSSR